MSNNKLIDLAAFRKLKGLKQSDIAKLIGTSPSFISLVETGNAKLPDGKIDIIINHFGVCGLIPCYDRLVNLEEKLIKDNYLKLQSQSKKTLPFEKELSNSIIEGIKHGRIAITNDIADTIITKYPIVNKNWLITGEGAIFNDEIKMSLLNVEKSISNLAKLIKTLNDKIDDLTSKQK